MKPLKLLALVLLAVFACSQPSAPVDAGPITSDVALAPVDPPSQDFPFSRKPRPQSFTPASPDTRSHDDLRIAACSGAPDADHPDGWRCQGKKPLTFKAGSSTPIIPTSWTVPNWFVNKSTGSDQNDCITALTACKTKQEIWVHRLGCAGVPGICPRFRQTTVLEQDVSDTDNTDPLYVSVSNENGATFSIRGGPMTCTNATFTRSAQKSRAVGTNSLLAGSFSAGAPAAGKMVVNTTAGKSSRAWIYTSAGGANWNLTQPLVPATVPYTTTTPAEVDTWATNDTVQVCTPVAINLVHFDDGLADFDGAFDNVGYVYQATIFDPTGISNDNFYIGRNIYLEEVASQRVEVYMGTHGDGFRAHINSMALGSTYAVASGNSKDPAFFGGAVEATLGSYFGANVLLDGDVIVGGNGSGGTIFTQNAILGLVFLDGNLTFVQGTVNVSNGNYGSAVLYGSGANTMLLQGATHVANLTGNNFQTTFTAPGLVIGIQLNGSVNASCNTGADPGVQHNATTTPAHLDAACGAGTGLGSAAFKFAGASVANF